MSRTSSPKLHGHRGGKPCSSPRLSGKAESETRPNQTNTGEPILTVAADPTETRLFLGSLGLGLVPHTLLPDTHQAGVGPRLAEGLVGAALDVLGERALGDLAEAGSDGLRDAERAADALCGLAGLLVLGGVGLLGLVGLAGENDKAGLILLQALDVGGEALLGEVLAAGIDRDADGGSVELGNAGGLFFALESRCFPSFLVPERPSKTGSSYLELSQREATAEACPAVILDGAAGRN